MGAAAITANEASSSTCVKAIVLGWLTVQTSVCTLLLRHSQIRALSSSSKLVPFRPSVGVLMTELLKSAMCTLTMCALHGRACTLKMLRAEVMLSKNRRNLLKIFVPTLLYTIQNNLVYVGASHLDSASFLITYQLKILFTAVFSVLLLRRHPNALQWFAICILFVGVTIIGLQQQHRQGDEQKNSNAADEKRRADDDDVRSLLAQDADDVVAGGEGTSAQRRRAQNPTFGFIVVAMCSMTSAFSGVFLEKMFKEDRSVSMLVRNLQMSLISISFALVVICMKDGAALFKADQPLLIGFDSFVWLLVCWQSAGGLAVAACLRFANNIAKDFAASNAIVVVMLVSIALFEFEPSARFVLGTALVIASTLLYSSASALHNTQAHIDKVVIGIGRLQRKQSFIY